MLPAGARKTKVAENDALLQSRFPSEQRIRTRCSTPLVTSSTRMQPSAGSAQVNFSSATLIGAENVTSTAAELKPQPLPTKVDET